MDVRLEPTVSSNGELGIKLRGTFGFDLLKFEVEPPDGPAPQNHIIKVDVAASFF